VLGQHEPNMTDSGDVLRGVKLKENVRHTVVTVSAKEVVFAFVCLSVSGITRKVFLTNFDESFRSEECDA